MKKFLAVLSLTTAAAAGFVVGEYLGNVAVRSVRSWFTPTVPYRETADNE